MDYSNIEFVDIENVGNIVNTLIAATKIPHDEYESVKIYGDSLFILDILKCILRDNQYDEIRIASLDITSSDIDNVCKDDYVLILTDNLELYVQSAWNGNKLYANEAKYTMCQKNINPLILKNISF